MTIEIGEPFDVYTVSKNADNVEGRCFFLWTKYFLDKEDARRAAKGIGPMGTNEYVGTHEAIKLKDGRIFLVTFGSNIKLTNPEEEVYTILNKLSPEQKKIMKECLDAEKLLP